MEKGIIMLALAPFLGVGLSWLLVLKLIPLLVPVSLSLSCLGLLVASRMRSQQGFQVVMQLLIFPLMFLSGVFFPVNSVPTWLGVIAKANPVTYGVDAIRQGFLGNGAGPVPAGAMAGGRPTPAAGGGQVGMNRVGFFLPPPPGKSPLGESIWKGMASGFSSWNLGSS